MPQPPDSETVVHVLDRAQALLGREAANVLADALASDWRAAAQEGPQQALYAAAWQLWRATRWRALGNVSLANMADHLAEACITGWRDEVAVGTTAVEDSPAG